MWGVDGGEGFQKLQLKHFSKQIENGALYQNKVLLKMKPIKSKRYNSVLSKTKLIDL